MTFAAWRAYGAIRRDSARWLTQLSGRSVAVAHRQSRDRPARPPAPLPARWSVLLKHRLTVLKTDPGTSVLLGSEGQRNGASSGDERGANQDKGGQGRRIECHIQASGSSPIMKPLPAGSGNTTPVVGSLDDATVLRETAHPTGSILCSAHPPLRPAQRDRTVCVRHRPMTAQTSVFRR